MRLITEKGQLDLPSAFSFTIEQNSPVFSNEGTQSIPTNLPTSSRNISALSYPNRLGRSEKFQRKLSAKLEAGVYHKNGQLVIDTSEMKSGIIGAIMLNESDLYSKIKDLKLKEVFKDINRLDYMGESNPVQSWYNRIYNCMAGIANDDFTAFPIAVNRSDVGYEILNSPDLNSSKDPYALLWQERTILVESEQITVPAGYGITPFLWMYRFLEILFSIYGYTITSNPFKEDTLLKKIVLINNTADTICAGVLKYSDLVPSCSVSEFLIFIEKKFLVHTYINAESKTIELKPLQGVLEAAPDFDIAPFVDGEIKFTFFDPKELDISSDTTLEGASPAAPTLQDLTKKYDSLNEFSEFDWRSRNWIGGPELSRYLIYRKATGEYYEAVSRMISAQKDLTLLGTNYFRHYGNKLSAQEYKAADLMPPMVPIYLGTIPIMCPFVGESIHFNTVYKDQKNDVDQKIILAYAAGRAEVDEVATAKYFFGTTQKYNNLGNVWCDHELTAQGLYPQFFEKWDEYLQNSDTQIECKVDYPDKQLLSLKLSCLKSLSGRLLLQKSLSFNVSDKISHNSSVFVVLRKGLP